MRITNSIVMRGFNRDLKRVGNLKDKTMHRITTTRQFNRASETPLTAAKALNVRKSMYFSDQYKENLSVADSFYTEAETSLLKVSEELAEIRETIVAACNTTKDSTEYNIYSQQLETKVKQLCSVFNTDTAGRAIFGGSSDESMPFTIEFDAQGYASTVLYHGVPLNALSDPGSFPYSDEVFGDIGLGLNIDQQTQVIDPQSALRISFNGAEITGSGTEKGTADIDLSSIKLGKKYCIDVYADNVKKTIEFTGAADAADNLTAIQDALNEAFKKSDEIPKIDEQGVISLENGGIVCALNNPFAERTGKLAIDNDSGYTNKFKVNFDKLEDGKEYTIEVKVGDVAKKITFTASEEGDYEAARDENLANIQAALDAAFADTGYKPVISKTQAVLGTITCEGQSVELSTIVPEGVADAEESITERDAFYSNNYLQLTLDAVKALRSGDIDYANGCIDRIVESSEKLLSEIANLGCNEDFISFNVERLTTREFNLSERQNELETADLESESTLMKTYSALYNACLQMASQVVPNSIFNYIS